MFPKFPTFLCVTPTKAPDLGFKVESPRVGGLWRERDRAPERRLVVKGTERAPMREMQFQELQEGLWEMPEERGGGAWQRPRATPTAGRPGLPPGLNPWHNFQHVRMQIFCIETEAAGSFRKPCRSGRPRPSFPQVNKHRCG